MQAIRLIHQSFISSIKTGSPWDSDLQAEEWPHREIKDGHACLTLSSATCAHTSMLSPQHCQTESRLNLSHSGLLPAMQQFSSRVQIKKLRRSGMVVVHYSSENTYMLPICAAYTRPVYFRDVFCCNLI